MKYYFFKQTEDIKPFINVPQNLEVNDIQAELRKAGEEYIIPEISEAQWNALVSKYNSTTTLTTQESALLEKIRAPLIQFGLYRHYMLNQAEWTGAGFTQRNNGEGYSKSDFRDVNRQLNYLLEDAHKQNEKLHLWLEKNRNTYTTYKNSAERKERLKFFIHTATQFKKSSLEVSALTFSKLYAAIDHIENFEILPAIGDTYFNEIKTELLTSVSDNNQKPLEYIRKAIAPLVIRKAMMDNIIRLDGSKVVLIEDRSSYQSKRSPDSKFSSKLSPVLKSLQEAGAKWQNKLLTHLNNSPTIYTSYHEYIELDDEEEEEITLPTNEKESSFYRA